MSLVPVRLSYNGTIFPTQIGSNLKNCIELQGASGALVPYSLDIFKCNTEFYKSVVSDFDPNVSIRIASSLFPPAYQPLNESFVSKVKQNYGTQVVPIDYNDGELLKKNVIDYIADHSEGKLSNFSYTFLEDEYRNDHANVIVIAFHIDLNWSTPGFPYKNVYRRKAGRDNISLIVPFVRNTEPISLESRSYEGNITSIVLPLQNSNYSIEFARTNYTNDTMADLFPGLIFFNPIEKVQRRFSCIEIPTFHLISDTGYAFNYYYKSNIKFDALYSLSGISTSRRDMANYHSNEQTRFSLVYNIDLRNISSSDMSWESTCEAEDSISFDKSFFVNLRFNDKPFFYTRIGNPIL